MQKCPFAQPVDRRQSRRDGPHGRIYTFKPTDKACLRPEK